MPYPVAGGVSRFAWTSVKPKQQSKQYPPKLVTELGIVMLVKPEQNQKHPFPKLVTELGIVVFLQPLNIVFVAVSMMALQFSRES